MVWPFRRKPADDPDSMDVEVLRARANAASPNASTTTDATVGSFRIPVDDIFQIAGRGLVVTGRVESGTVSVGMDVEVTRAGQVVTSAKVKAIEMFREVRDSATAGETIGVLLGDLPRETVQQGDLLVG